MSTTNIRLEKICHFCTEHFIAQKVTTKYCSHTCSAKHYKIRKREEKVKKVSIAQRKKFIKIKNGYSKNHLTYSIDDVISLVGVSRTTIYRWRKQKLVKFTRIGQKIFIDRKSLEKLFNI